MIYFSIALLTYLIVGLFESKKLIDFVEELIILHEQGVSLPSGEEELLDNLSELNALYGGKLIYSTVYLLGVVLWLPLNLIVWIKVK